ncbi:hypothetical protein [Amycolatopsis sp. CA-126428]|uniref:hypothetical protein n=1 Tax=Amycolatopsis sp. CA-126428 TaxID=2073158 RepID=UPI000CD1B71D|nr:hypothetical protein [Amycolatopsis sp. CA-126428]
MEIELLPPSAAAAVVERVRLGDATGGLRMVAAGPARRGVGAEQELVRFAERARQATGCRERPLELLVPRDLAEDYPHLAPSLATPCDFLIYRKDLR